MTKMSMKSFKKNAIKKFIYQIFKAIPAKTEKCKKETLP